MATCASVRGTSCAHTMIEPSGLSRTQFDRIINLKHRQRPGRYVLPVRGERGVAVFNARDNLVSTAVG